MDPERAGLPAVGAGTAASGGLSWPQGARVLAAAPAGEPGPGSRAGTDPLRPAVSVLADRLAAALVHHEPGWRLPRHSALARRYSVSTAEIDAAIEDLVARHLIRRLADGQLYRASPAEYVIGLEGVRGLASLVDAMGGEFTCRSRQVSWRLPPEDISWALRIPPAEPVCVVRLLWTAGGEPAAFCTTYVPGDVAGHQEPSGGRPLPTVLSLLRPGQVSDTPIAGEPSALYVEMQAPPPSVARSLRLSPGQPAMMVTVRFEDPELGRSVALTTAVLRADMFRLVLQTPDSPRPDDRVGSLAVSWTDAAEDWEP